MPSDVATPPATAPARRPLRELVVQAQQLIADPLCTNDRVMRSTVFLIKQGFLQDAAVGLRRLDSAGVHPARVKRLAMLVGYLLRRGWGRGLGSVSGQGRDWKIVGFSPESDVHVATREGAKRALFVFAGVGPERRAAFDLTLLLQLLRAFDAHIFMLRDSRTLLYMNGLRGLSDNVEESALRLKAMASDLGAERFFTMGNCGGSFASLRYALDMGAEAAICFAPRTDYSGSTPIPSVDAAIREQLEALVPPEMRDMRAAYLRNGKAPRVEIHYGSKNDLDSAHALHFADVPGAALHAVPDAAGRYIVPRLFRTGEFEAALGRLLDLPVVRPAAVRRRSQPPAA